MCDSNVGIGGEQERQREIALLRRAGERAGGREGGRERGSEGETNAGKEGRGDNGGEKKRRDCTMSVKNDDLEPTNRVLGLLFLVNLYLVPDVIRLSCSPC